MCTRDFSGSRRSFQKFKQYIPVDAGITIVCAGNVLIDTTVDAGMVIVVRDPEIDVVMVSGGIVMRISSKSELNLSFEAAYYLLFRIL